MKVHRSMILLFLMIFASTTTITVSLGAISSTQDGITLNILTRHSSEIWSTYKTEFLASDYATSAGIDNIIFYTYAESSWVTQAQTGTMDLAWGGGPTLFDNLIVNDLVDPLTDSAVLMEVNKISDTIAGAPMKRMNELGQILWSGAAISSFGFTINKYVLDSKGLPYPETWTQLLHPQYFSEVAPLVGMGNAPDTTSNTRIYEIIIQRFGWEVGWGLLTAMAGNSRMYHGSTEVLSAVTSGEVGIGMTIDFYGFGAQLSNPDTQYILPEGQSIVNADPICLIKDGDPTKKEAANNFIEYVLSQEGQSIWLETNINRLPVRADAFDTPRGLLRPDLENSYNITVNNAGIDFNDTESLSYHGSLLYYFQSTLTDAHAELTSAWKDIVNAWKNSGTANTPRIQNYNLTEWIKALGEPFIDKSEAQAISDDLEAGGTLRTTKMNEWTAAAKSRYSQIQSKVATSAETPDTTSPIISNVVVTDSDNATATIEWDTNEPTTTTLRYGLTTSLSKQYSNEENVFDSKDFPMDHHTVYLENLVPGGKYYFEVQAKDLSGNSAVSNNDSSYYTFELVDTAAPIIINIQTTALNDTAIISWSTDEFSDSRVNYGTTTALGSTEYNANEVLEHEVTLTGLTPLTQYYFEINSSDGIFFALDDNEGAKYTFTTTEFRNDLPPVILGLEVNVTETTALISFKTDKASRINLYYGVGTTDILVSTTSLSTSHLFELTDLDQDVEYSFYILASDAFNNTARYPSGTGVEKFTLYSDDTTSKATTTRDAIPGFDFSVMLLIFPLLALVGVRKKRK